MLVYRFIPPLTEVNTITVVVGAKTTSNAYETIPFPPGPNSSQSTINTVEREIREAGGNATAIPVDVRDTTQIENLVKETVRVYGSLDVLVYNSGAIWWSSVENTPTKRFQLMQRINPEGLYASVQAALPEFARNGWKGRIIVVSPPIYSRFFRGKTAYAMGLLFLLQPVPKIVAYINRQGWDERSHQRSGDGFCPTGQKGDGNFESLARCRMSNQLFLPQLVDNMAVY